MGRYINKFVYIYYYNVYRYNTLFNLFWHLLPKNILVFEINFVNIIFLSFFLIDVILGVIFPELCLFMIEILFEAFSLLFFFYLFIKELPNLCLLIFILYFFLIIFFLFPLISISIMLDDFLLFWFQSFLLIFDDSIRHHIHKLSGSFLSFFQFFISFSLLFFQKPAILFLSLNVLLSFSFQLLL